MSFDFLDSLISDPEPIAVKTAYLAVGRAAENSAEFDKLAAAHAKTRAVMVPMFDENWNLEPLNNEERARLTKVGISEQQWRQANERQGN
jgi:hypothetical protein